MQNLIILNNKRNIIFQQLVDQLAAYTPLITKKLYFIYVKIVNNKNQSEN